MLDGWQLDVETSSNSAVVVDREGTRTIVEVSECWDIACLASRPPTGLSGIDGDEMGDGGLHAAS
jgi:hypothetical protein